MTEPDGAWATLVLSSPIDPLPEVVRTWILNALLFWQPEPAAHAALVVEELIADARAHGRPPHIVRITTTEDHRGLVIVLDDRTAASRPSWSNAESATWTLLRGLTHHLAVAQRTEERTVCAEIVFDEDLPDVLVTVQPEQRPRSEDGA
jgi:two-component sensor histidine kinase